METPSGVFIAIAEKTRLIGAMSARRSSNAVSLFVTLRRIWRETARPPLTVILDQGHPLAEFCDVGFVGHVISL
jgi:hypothetical protein